MTIIANGKQRDVRDGATVRDFLAQHGLTGERVVIEYNGEPLGRERFAHTQLRSGDTLEIAQMVGGG